MPADTLKQVEPDNAGAFVVRPYSLTAPELGGLPAVLASAPTPVLAWVRYPATADQVHGHALAWTPRAVYIEWEGEGTHRAWVWASAVERPATSDKADSSTPPQQQANVLTVLNTQPAVALINAQLTQNGSEFVASMTQPAGPFGVVVFGSIEGEPVRLALSVNAATDMCAVGLSNLVSKEILSERAAPTFEEAIEAFPWAAALDALAPD
ncbi:hypothetical protein C3B59_00815 [Cryobacterium zongtaii]|uniref:Uncharacterized protein n=1 Tax=Cryobacterium zongtaii TaxID=1259217 RepID=A0A2S3ZQD6_9MICO|nr:hypothetical protein C3B59_00815 [Cryobacterium zongtaii]